MEIWFGVEKGTVCLAQSFIEGFLGHLSLRENGRDVSLTTCPHPVQI